MMRLLWSCVLVLSLFGCTDEGQPTTTANAEEPKAVNDPVASDPGPADDVTRDPDDLTTFDDAMAAEAIERVEAQREEEAEAAVAEWIEEHPEDAADVEALRQWEAEQLAIEEIMNSSFESKRYALGEQASQEGM